MKVIEAPVYRSDDGLREFKSQDECIEYEKFILLRAIIHKHARGIVYQAEVANFILKAWSEISLAMQHNGEARAIESAAQPAPAAVPLTDEQDRALCEAHYNDASEEYFSARPQMDSAVNRRIFYAGHRKGWLAMLAAAGDKP